MRLTTYAVAARVAALALGTGSLALTASDGDRVQLMLGECRCVYERCDPNGCPVGGYSLQWSGCQTLARELAGAGVLLLLGSVPVPDRHDGR